MFPQFCSPNCSSSRFQSDFACVVLEYSDDEDKGAKEEEEEERKQMTARRPVPLCPECRLSWIKLPPL